MNGRNTAIVSALSLAAGVILLLTYQSISSEGVVIAGGALFIAAGLLSFLYTAAASRRSDGAEERQPALAGRIAARVSAAGAVVLGLSMLLFTEVFATLVPFLFGLFAAVCAAAEVYIVMQAWRRGELSAWWVTGAAALAAVAVYLFTRRPADGHDPDIMMATGIALTLFGALAAVQWLAAIPARRRLRADAAVAPAVAELRALDEPQDA